MSAPETKIRLSTSAQIAESLPYLLGYNPIERLITIGLRGKRVGLTCAVELNPMENHDRPYLTAMAAQLVGALSRDGATEVLVVVVSDLDQVGLLSAVQVAAAAAGITVRASLLVRHGMVYDLDHDEPAEEVRLTAASAEFAAVIGPVGSRHDLIAPLTPVEIADPVAQLEAITEAAWRLTDDVAGVAEEVLGHLAGETTAAEPLLLAGLADLQIRDLALGTLVGERGQRVAVMDRLAGLAAVAPGPFRAAPATIWAIGAYLDGNGAAARQGAELALAADGGYTLARLLDAALDAAVSPADLTALCTQAVAGVRADLGL